MKATIQETDTLKAFSTFAKGAKVQKKSITSCVIYTRVSSKEQTKGMSLETQRKDCELYARRNKMNIMGHFGGTYESAKTDERAEFNRMLTFLEKSKEHISIIIVYSVDRFSRSGANAIYIADQLKKKNIVVYSVSQPTDASTSSGTLQQNMQFIFSEYENQQRRDKCMAGIKEKLMAGIWCTMVPTGYDIVKSEGKQKRIVLNAKGKLIKYAFQLKSMGLSSEAVRGKLAEKGLRLSNQRMSDILRNPFYCGLVVHKTLEGEIVKGIQEVAVSQEMFLKVNDILTGRHKSGYSAKPTNEETPLKRFIKCETCGNCLVAYKAIKNKKYYYKCSTIGCACNKRADDIHAIYKDMLNEYMLGEFGDDMNYLLTQHLMAKYNTLTDDNKEQREGLEKELNELSQKINRLEERYVEEDITKDMYNKYVFKYNEEMKVLEEALGKTGSKLSNLENCVSQTILLSTKLATVWDLSNYTQKQAINFLLFPEGIYYNRKNEHYRTPKVNEVFSYISSLQRLLANEKSGNVQENLNVAALVEPTRERSHPFYDSLLKINRFVEAYP